MRAVRRGRYIKVGASISYRVVAPTKSYLSVATPSMFIDSMNRAFGHYPWRLGPQDASVLKGMAAMWYETTGLHNPYQQMIDLIEPMDDAGIVKPCIIEVWPEY